MLNSRGTFRLFVTLLLTVAVPFCCCNLHAWLMVCSPCHAASDTAGPELAAHHHGDSAAHDHESDHHSTTASTACVESSTAPCGPGHDDDHDCTCSKQDTLLTVAKSNLDLPTPVLVAIVLFPAIADASASPPFRAFERGLWVSVRPPTTLLGLHCALIV